MEEITSPDAIDLRRYVRPGDTVIWGQGSGEPVLLTSALMAQRAAFGPISTVCGTCFSNAMDARYTDFVTFKSFGASGSRRALAAQGLLEIIPSHQSLLPHYLAEGVIQCDVALVQLPAARRGGGYGFGTVTDYIVDACKVARHVIVELSDQVPETVGPHSIPVGRISLAVRSSEPPIAVSGAPRTAVSDAIATHVLPFVPDGAILQVGIGEIPDAILGRLNHHRRLGIHSGMIGDKVVDLIESGAVTNETSPRHRGVCVTGLLLGSERLYRFAHRNSQIEMHTTAYTHNPDVLAALPRFVSINSAAEVDLTGQVNSEVVANKHVGSVGGQVDFVRGAHRSEGGHAIIALPATAAGGTVSRLVPVLSGPVTTARSDVDVVVTEFGAAELRGRTLTERAAAIVNIAHPAFQEELLRATHELRRSGWIPISRGQSATWSTQHAVTEGKSVGDMKST